MFMWLLHSSVRSRRRLNLKRETGEKDFEKVGKEGKKVWNKELGRIKVEGGTIDQQRTFYSCLYRMILFPRGFYEINGKNDVVHYSPYNGEVLPGYMYTDNGFWDTFRALFPFTTVMYPELNSRIMEGLVNTYKESGWLAGMGQSRPPRLYDRIKFRFTYYGFISEGHKRL